MLKENGSGVDIDSACHWPLSAESIETNWLIRMVS